MNRVLKRPMFRMGGSSGTGITSGLDKPRAQFQNGSTLERLQKATGAVPNNRNLSQFLTTFGLDLLSRPPSGGFFFYSGTGCTTTNTTIISKSSK